MQIIKVVLVWVILAVSTAYPLVGYAQVMPSGALLNVESNDTFGDERPLLVAQRRTLLDLLFGNNQPEPEAPARTAPAAPRAPQIVPVVAEVPKTAGATRLMVFGDSLALDLAKGLERTFAEDPNLTVLSKGVGSSGFVRDDFYDWNAALREEIAADSFDLAVVIIGINDRQPIGSAEPLSEEWKTAYTARLNAFLAQMRQARKPVIWVGLPPMRARSYSADITQISSLHRLASVSGGAEFADIFERFTDENGAYTERGPDLNGQNATMRKGDGIHFSSAGSDKVAFYVSQAMRRYYRGGSVSLEVTDPLDGTDAQAMIRLPFQGNGEFRLLQVAGAVLPLNSEPQRANELVLADPIAAHEAPFTLDQLVRAPIGRADAFGVGIAPPEVSDEALISPES